MALTRLIFLVFAAAFVGLVSSFGQTVDHPHCFQIRLAKDGLSIPGPTTVTFIGNATKLDIGIQDSRFCAPKEMIRQETLDLTFIAASERFYLPGIPIERFGADWDIAIGKDVAKRARSSKSPNPNRACSVVFRQGEPEIEMITSPCRTPLATRTR